MTGTRANLSIYEPKVTGYWMMNNYEGLGDLRVGYRKTALDSNSILSIRSGIYRGVLINNDGVDERVGGLRRRKKK